MKLYCNSCGNTIIYPLWIPREEERLTCPSCNHTEKVFGYSWNLGQALMEKRVRSGSIEKCYQCDHFKQKCIPNDLQKWICWGENYSLFKQKTPKVILADNLSYKGDSIDFSKHYKNPKKEK